MFSVFPALFDFSLLGIFALRVTVGIIFLLFGFRLMQAAYSVPEKSRFVRTVGFLYGAVKLCIGIFLTFGVYTQIGAIGGMVFSVFTFMQEDTKHMYKANQQVQLLLFVICFALLFLGPGQFGIDYPL
jgi:uncharacterized membrane protein YphA (DoxX/SURF4 family)